MSVARPASPDPREGYIFGTRNISKVAKTAILECNMWFSHDGKNASRAEGKIISRSTAHRPQKVMDTNYNKILHHLYFNIFIMS